MATNDKGAGPILGQQVLYQVTGTHAIVTGTGIVAARGARTAGAARAGFS
jgi:hypothetical protein